MGSANSELEIIKNMLSIFKNTIKDLSDGVKSLAGFYLIDKAVKEVSKVNSEFSDEEKKALQCIIEASKNITIALNDSKNLVSDVKSLCTTLRRVINSKAGSNDEKIRLAISVFEKSMADLLPKLDNSRDGLSKVTIELQTIALKITNLQIWFSSKKEELKNVKNSSVAKERGLVYGSVAGAVISLAGTVAATRCWNPVGWVAGIVATGTVTASAGSVSCLIAAGVAETTTIPQLKEMYEDGIKKLDESANKFREMSTENIERTESLSEKMKQLREITSRARQAKHNASATLEFGVDDIMFNILKEDVKELECLCDTYLKK